MTEEQARQQQGQQPAGQDTYDVNFFKPKSEHSRADMKIVSTLVIIWAVAVFGFQFLLIATSKPTPEPAYNDFQSVWEDIKADQADTADTQNCCRAVLAVLGKNIAVSEADKVILKESLSSLVQKLLPDDQKSLTKTYADNNSALRESATADQDTALLASTNAQTTTIAGAIGLANTGFDKIMTDLLPTSIVGTDQTTLSDNAKNALPGIMKLYLVHNRGALTDLNFMGFPFHYWYTAQFLLILFVVLCLIYATIIDKINKKYNFTEK